MNEQKRTQNKLLLLICFLLISIQFVSAQDSLYIYRNGQILYRSQADQIDSVTFHLPEYWDWKESEAVYQKIRSNPELSIFADMLEQSGYKDKLNDKTIWVPVNASFEGVDLSDGDLVKNLVENHLRSSTYPFIYSIESNFPMKMTMLSNKQIEMTKVNDLFYMDGIRVIQPNISALTSVIHILDGYVPYRKNLWEYLYSAGNVDSMRTFLFSYNKKTYNPVTKDSLVSNDLLTSLNANLKLEWQKFTVLIPDDQTWKATYDSLMKTYPSTTNLKLLAQQRTNVKLYMIKHLFMGGRTLGTWPDSVYTTKYKLITNPTELFGEANLVATLSNGNCYSIKKLNIPLTLQKGIIVEAEDSINRTSTYCQVIKRESTGNPAFPISNSAYNYCFPLTTSSLQKISVTYSVNNLLPGLYNIYAQFVPAFAEDSTLQNPYKVNFYLTYSDTAGVTVSNKLIISNVVTNSNAMTKVLVLQNFVMNQLDPQINSTTASTLKLKIENAAITNESATLSREIRTDCIIFKPVD